MKTNKIYLIFTILLVALVTLSNVVNASTSFNLKLNSTKTSYSKGDTVTVNIDLSNVTDQSGIAGYQAKLSYDSNVLTLDSFTSNDWEVMQNEGAIVANTKDALGTSSGTTAIAKFKVNENTTESSTTIKMTSIKGTSGDLETLEGTSSELKITIKTTDDSNDNTNGGTSNGGTSNGGTTNGGTTNGGTSNGGTSNAGTTNGGTTNGGTTNGGTTNGGTSNGGTSNGGTSNGGTSNGGTSNGGTSNGGTSNGGTSNGGTTNGGTSNGGTNNNKVNNTTTGSKIPYAGAENVIGIVALVAVIGIVSFVKYRKTF